MDTKQKTRPTDPRRQSRSAEQNKSGTRRRSSDASRSRQNTVKTAERTVRRNETTARRPEQEKRRSPEPAERRRAASRTLENRTRERAESNARQVKSEAPEMVFKPAQEPKKTPKPKEKKRASLGKRSAQRVKERQEQKKRQANRPDVVYTPPKPVNWNRLLLQIAVVMAVVLAVVIGLSVFFKVDQVVVYGNHAYSAWTIQEAAGIEGGENLLTFNSTRASGKITAALPYVENVRIGIKLPDTVNIYIKEIDVAYAIQSQNGTWWLMTSGGNVVEQIDAGTAGGYTKVLGVELDNPTVGQPGKPVEFVTQATPDATDDSTEPGATEAVTPVVVTGQDRLNAALVILAALEANDIVGEAASVDVTSLSNIELWYGRQYQVYLGDSDDMEYKISCMKAAIAQRKEYDTGILDVSFTTWPDQVGFTPSDS